MTRWAKDANEYTVRVTPNKNRDGSTTYLLRLPKPLFDMLGEPINVCFKVAKNKIVVDKPGDE